MSNPKKISGTALKQLWIVSLLAGALGFAGALYCIASPGGPGLDWIWGIAAFGVAAVLYNLVFFLLCSIFAPGLSNYVEDDTEVQGDDVVHVVHYSQAEDPDIDRFVKTYATARGTSAVAIISGIMIAVAWNFL